MKLAKFWNTFLISVMALGTVIAIFSTLNSGNSERLLTQIAIFPILLLPFVINKTKLHFNAIMQTYFYVFIFLAQFLGCVLNFYGLFDFFDVFVHFLSGIVSCFLAIYILVIAKSKNSLPYELLFLIGFTCFGIVAWEIYEFGCDSILGMNVQHAIETGVADTMIDMIAALSGAILFCLLYIVEDTRKKGIISTFKNQINQ